MPVKILSPIKEEPSIFDTLEEMIRKIFRDEIYLPLVKQLQRKLIHNKKGDDDYADYLLRKAYGQRGSYNPSAKSIIDALRSGAITYKEDQFEGKFNSSISKQLKSLGATFNKQTKGWKIPTRKLPPDIRNAIQNAQYRFQENLDQIIAHVQKLLPEEIAEKLTSENFFDKVLKTTDDKIKDRLSSMIVKPKISEEARAQVASEYTKNLQKYVKQFAEEEKQTLSEKMIDLRTKVQEHVLSGGREDDLTQIIQQRYDVSKNKAKFLARQETGLLMAKFQKATYQDVGINIYKWKCVKGSVNHPVRPTHKVCDEKYFSWDHSYEVDQNGNRKPNGEIKPHGDDNPGEDYNCRCSAMPVVKYNL